MRVIGIGASAGGMEALIELLSNIPDNTGAAFVLVVHLSPDHHSILDELLARYTPMPISIVEQYTQVLPNHIYLISKDHNLTFDRGMLLTHPRKSGQGLNLPIDQFFHSLGENLQESAIGVILSGTGTDGSRGVRTIKEAGGLVLVQSPESAKFDGMPQAVIRLQLADRVLPPKELALMLTDIIRIKTEGREPELLTELDKKEGKGYLARILQQVFTVTGVNFSGYREATLNRRLANRVLLHRLEDPEQYLKLLLHDNQEVLALQKDFLIGVTRFFRNPEAFEVLDKLILPKIVEEKKDDDLLRIWVPACSTGEEAYSIGMVISRFLEKNKLNLDFKIFGTDVDHSAIKLAADGTFTFNSTADILPDLQHKYFVRESDFFRIKGDIRDKMLFAVHNLLNDPPFIHMDLISCRNALIYFKNPAQRSILSTFHFALNPKGYLFLGPSESLGEVKHAYTQLHKEWNFFQKRENTHLPHQSRIQLGSIQIPRVISTQLPAIDLPAELVDMGGQHPDPFARFLLQQYVPDILFVNEQLDVIYLQGELDEVLSFPSRGGKFNLQNMLDAEAVLIFSKGVEKAVNSNEPALFHDVVLRKYGQEQLFDLRFHQVEFPNGGTAKVMVEIRSKERSAEQEEQQPSEEQVEKNSLLKEHIRSLEDKLTQARHSREHLVSQLESANEELQTSNRELLAANEELQSTNEELQSMNEELYTVNNELQIKNENLTTVNNDISNLMKSTEIGTIFLDTELRIRRFTPAIKEQFNLLESDIGRPITHFSSTFESLDIAQISRQVFDSLESFGQEVKDRHGNYYLLRILPYRTEKNAIRGLVISFVDVNELIIVREQIETFANKFQAIFEHSKELIIVLERDGSIRRINQPIGGHSPQQLLSTNFFEILPGALSDQLQALMNKTYEEQLTQEIAFELPDGKNNTRFYKGSVIPVKDQTMPDQPIRRIMLMLLDITNDMRAVQQMEETIVVFQAFMDNTVQQIILVDRQGIIKHINFIRFNQLERSDLIGTSIFNYSDEYQTIQIGKAIEQVFAGKTVERIEYEVNHPDGYKREVELIGTPVIINEAVRYAALIVHLKGE